MDFELKNVSVYSKDLYWMLKAIVQLEKDYKASLEEELEDSRKIDKIIIKATKRKKLRK